MIGDADVLRHAFRSMGTDVELVTDGRASPAAFIGTAEAVRAAFVEDEARFSRFRADSELSRVNAAAGRWTMVTAPFAEAIVAALQAAERTDGLFDATVLRAVLAAGYEGDLADVRPDRARDPGPGAAGRWADVVLEDRRCGCRPTFPWTSGAW